MLTLREEGYPVCGVAFSPDGQLVASGHRNGGIALWDSHTGRRVRVLRAEGLPAWSVAFSPDGRLLATAAGDYARPDLKGEVLLWDLATGRVTHALEGHAGCAWTVAFSPDGHLLASSAGELIGGPGEVKLWDAADRTARAGATRVTTERSAQRRLLAGR